MKFTKIFLLLIILSTCKVFKSWDSLSREPTAAPLFTIRSCKIGEQELQLKIRFYF